MEAIFMVLKKRILICFMLVLLILTTACTQKSDVQTEKQAKEFVSIIYTSANADAYENLTAVASKANVTEQEIKDAYKPYSDKLEPLVTANCFEALVASALPTFADALAKNGNAITVGEITLEKSASSELQYTYTAPVTVANGQETQASGIIAFVEEDGKYYINSLQRTDTKVFSTYLP